MFKQSVLHKDKGWFFPLFFKNWWVAAYLLMAIALYVQALYQKNQLVSVLEGKLSTLEKAKEEALLEKEELTLRLKSEEDPEWMELVLKKRLGLVEEGETKVIFSKGRS